MEAGRWVGFGVMGALVVALVLLICSAGCPDVRTAMVSPAEVALALDRRHLAVVEVPDATAKVRGVTILRATVGGTGIVAAISPDQTWTLLTDEPRWNRRLTPGYLRNALNVVFYALRGGSEVDRSRVRVAISRTYRHFYPARPLQCQDE